MSDNLPYDAIYIEKVFKDRPDLKEQVDNIINRLKGLPSYVKLTAAQLEAYISDLLSNVLKAFVPEGAKTPQFEDLNPDQRTAMFQFLDGIAKELVGHGKFETTQQFISVIIDHLYISYEFGRKILTPEGQEVDLLTEEDKKRIKEELKRMAIYELYKMLNPSQVAGESPFQNFFNNIIVGGLKLASLHEGKEFLEKLSKSEQQNLLQQHNTFKQDFNVENVKGAVQLTPKGLATGKSEPAQTKG